MNYKIGLAALAASFMVSCSSVQNTQHDKLAQSVHQTQISPSYDILKRPIAKVKSLFTKNSKKASTQTQNGDLVSLVLQTPQSQLRGVMQDVTRSAKLVSYVKPQILHKEDPSAGLHVDMTPNYSVDYLLFTRNAQNIPFAFEKVDLLKGLFPYISSHLQSERIAPYARKLDIPSLYGILSAEFAPVVKHTSTHSNGEKGAFPLDTEMARIWKLYDGVSKEDYAQKLSQDPVFNVQEAIEYLHELYNMPNTQDMFTQAPTHLHGKVLLGIIRGDIAIPKSGGTASKNYNRLLRGESMMMPGLSDVEAKNRLKNFSQGQNIGYHLKSSRQVANIYNERNARSLRTQNLYGL
jgi:hypothetical protein